MKTILTLSLIFLLVHPVFPDLRIDQKRKAFFHDTTPLKGQTAAPSKKEDPLFEILSVAQSVVPDYEEEKGMGTPQLRCIEVRFKIQQAGTLRIPFIYVYLYNSKKKLIQRLENFFVRETTRSVPADAITFVFKGKQAYTVQFSYPKDITFKYSLAVIGNMEKISVRIEPGHPSWKDFDFAEKKRLQESHQ